MAATSKKTMRYVWMFVIATVLAIVYGQQCNVVPRCTCDFDGEAVEVEEQKPVGNEALAGAVGALGSLVVSGGGFGIWYLVKSRAGGPDSLLDRSDSAMSEDSVERGKKGKGPPPSYNPRFGTHTKNPNIYRAGLKDNLTHKVTAAGRSGLNAF